jgi:hypothetical protein
MNRWLRGLSVTAFLFLHSGSSWAFCEAEFEAFARADKIDPVEYKNKLGDAAIRIKRDQSRSLILENLKGVEDDLRKILTESHDELMVARRKAWICLYKWALGEKVASDANSGQTNSNSSSANNQSPQPYKPGTSTLDRYLTAPKEDCDAIPQSYNVSDRQFSVSQCRLRNANRDKYAANANANANAASAQPATNAQSAQQQSQQAQQAATIQQVRADQARQGKRRRHEPENEASHCLSVDATSPGFGGFVNKCNFKVVYNFCNYNPKKDSWAEFHTCGKSGAADFVGPGRTSAAHVKNTETVYFFGCKDPAWPVDVEYIPGRGISARCHTVGGN